jgi:hypothetical protein
MTLTPPPVDPRALLESMRREPTAFIDVIRRAARIDPDTFAAVMRRAARIDGKQWP